MGSPASATMERQRAIGRVRPGWLSRAIVSGFAASVMMLFAYMIAYGMAIVLSGVQLQNRPGSNQLAGWFHNLINNPVVDLARTNLYEALAVYIAGGLIWAALYAYFAEPILPRPAWLNGVLFSIAPFLFSVVVFLPLLGGGFLGLGLGAGPLPFIGNALLHVIYGATLGLVYGPYGDTIQASEGEYVDDDQEREAMLGSERHAARWLIGGIVVGAIIGVAAVMLTQMGPGGAEPLAFIVSTALISGAFGALIGSFAGLPGMWEAGERT